MGIVMAGARADQVEERLKVFEGLRRKRCSALQIFSNVGQDEVERVRAEASEFMPVDEIPSKLSASYVHTAGRECRDSLSLRGVDTARQKTPSSLSSSTSPTTSSTTPWPICKSWSRLMPCRPAFSERRHGLMMSRRPSLWLRQTENRGGSGQTGVSV